MKRSRLTIAVAFVLIVIFGLLLFVYQVRKSEVAVVTLFGKVDHVKETPGPGFRLPWPIENVYKLDQRIQNFEGRFEQVKLPDQNLIFLLVYVGWRIDDPALFFPRFTNGSVVAAQGALEDLVRSAKNEVAGQHRFPDFISTDEKQMKLTQIEGEILEKVSRQVKNLNYGIGIKFVQIKKIGLPEQVTQNVFDRMQAEREYYTAQIRSLGEEESTTIKSAADSTAAKMLSDADAQAYAIRGQGEAQMIKSLQVLQENPELAEFNMQIAALTQLLKEKATLVLDQSTSPLNLLQPIQPQKVESTNAVLGKAQ
ncbi:MAG: protease modulator HflC [Verrucomicrobiota bacterium]|jgi:membrane protease subunit HflC